MPWCPKCKAQYREGITVCADCKVDLVDSLEEVETAQAEEVEEETEILPEEMPAEESLTELEEENGEEVQDGKQAPKERASVYVSSADKAEDNKSSAYTLLIIGVIGMVLVILMALGVIPFFSNSTTKILTYVVMGSLFGIFIIMGIISFRNAAKFARKAAFEEELSGEMHKWAKEHLTKEKIDAMLDPEDLELPEELLYFKRAEKCRQRLEHQYMNLEEGFLEHFIEEIYPEIFEQ